MNGFVNSVKGFSQVSIDALVTQADELYINDVVIPPSAITDFNATDAIIGQVTCTWSPSVGAISYSLYTGTTELATDITSPYHDTFTGTRDYHVKSINSAGSTDSNIDSGTGTEVGDGVVIEGLQSGTSETVARNNSTVLNAYFSGSELNLIIPENTGTAPIDADGNTLTGYWAIWEKVVVNTEDMVITFVGGIMSHADIPDYDDTGYQLYTFDVSASGVTIYNILATQGGFDRSNLPGLYCVVRVNGNYNIGNVTFNGGTIWGGSSNAFQQGRNNTVFNDVTFRDCKEHLMYASGSNGDGTNSDNPTENDPAHYASGLHFNRCTFSNPGTSTTVPDQESNHVQLRSYFDVSLTDCTIDGISNTNNGYGILGTAITKLRVTNTTMFGFKSGAIWMGPDNEGIGGTSSDWVFDNIETEPNDGLAWLTRLVVSSDEITLNNSTFHGAMTLYGINHFNDCTFYITSYRLGTTTNCNVTFHNTTWNIYDSTTNRVLDSTAGTADITGTTTRICHKDGNVFNWDIIPGSCP